MFEARAQSACPGRMLELPLMRPRSMRPTVFVLSSAGAFNCASHVSFRIARPARREPFPAHAKHHTTHDTRKLLLLSSMPSRWRAGSNASSAQPRVALDVQVVAEEEDAW